MSNFLSFFTNSCTWKQLRTAWPRTLRAKSGVVLGNRSTRRSDFDVWLVWKKKSYANPNFFNKTPHKFKRTPNQQINQPILSANSADPRISVAPFGQPEGQPRSVEATHDRAPHLKLRKYRYTSCILYDIILYNQIILYYMKFYCII